MFVSVFLVLLLALSTLALTLPMTKAAEIPTYTFLTANPNPVGVDQTVSVSFWIDKVTPNAATVYGDRWSNLTLTITKPDGSTEIQGPYTLDAVASGYMLYTPSTVGKYYFQISFPGQTITNRGVTNDYSPSQSARVELTVQEEKIGYWNDLALPTGYWNRPLNGELRNVNQIASNWLAAASSGPHGPRAYSLNGNYQPYGSAPDSAHILWTREITFGGPVGGELGDIAYYPGESYERKFSPAIIMNGRLYYNQRLGASQWAGTYCVDIKTGETIWYLNSTDKSREQITFGQILDMETPNQHGAIAYLWGVQGSTYKMYDAFTGDWILDLTGVPSGTLVMGKNGEFLIYTLNAANNYMTLWNSTKALNPTIDTTWSWRVNQASVNVTAGYQWNVTLADVPGTQSITKMTNEVMYCRATHQSTPTAITTDVAYDIKDGKEPVQLFVQNRTYDGSIMNGPLSDGVFTTFVKELMVWYGYDVNTGAQLWGPTTPYENAWGMYQPYAGALAGDGKLLAYGYDGTVHCFDLSNGSNLWNYYVGSSGFETPYGTWPMKDSAVTFADGKVYAVTNEHSPNTPYFHGWRMHVINAETGSALWNISFIGLNPFIADGYALTLNYFDNQIYCFGIGESKTTVNVSPKSTSAGSAVMIEGTVTDQSPGAKGTAAISDKDQSKWMEYLYMQRAIPTDVEGVPVKLTAINCNTGESTDLGTAISDIAGNFGFSWTPTEQGTYQIKATFEGTESYGSSFSTTYIVVGSESVAPTVEPTATPTTSTEPTEAPTTMAPTASPSTVVENPGTGIGTETLLIAGAAAIIVIAIALVAIVLKKRA
jgi:hypothetical protein